MKTIMLAVLLATMGLVLAGCGAGRSEVRTGDEAAARRSRGQALYVTECGACHRLPQLSAYSREEWREIVPRMGKLAALNAGQLDDLRTYLESAAR